MSPLEVVPLAEFAAVEEPGVDALLGVRGDALIPQGSDTIVYGDGGAGKTTLLLDAALHLAAGDDWLGLPVEDARRVLMVENEGPRAMFRVKVRRKLKSWTGSALGDRLEILEAPWAEFSFASETAVAELAEIIEREKIDVLIAGPLARLGMDENGTLHEVATFMQRVAALRNAAGRPVAVILVHHSAKSGAVSGAWEGATDTLLHVEKGGLGKTILTVEKARWSPTQHGRKMTLRWTDGEGFEGAPERDLLAEIDRLQADRELRTFDEIREAVGGRRETLRDTLRENFRTIEGDEAKALGRSKKAVLYGQSIHSPNGGGESGRVGESGSQGRTLANPTPRRGVRGGASEPDPRDALARPTDESGQR